MVPRINRFLSLAIALTLLIPTAAPVYAASATHTALPPLPEWPIIGPIVRMLSGSTTEEAEPTPMPTLDPDIPEHRIRSVEDIRALEEISPNERVRIIATDEDLNRIGLEILQEANMVEAASLNVDFEPSLVTADLQLSSELLEQVDLPVEIPVLLRGRNINATATMGIEAVECSVHVRIDKIKVNNWSLGLRSLAARTINESIPQVWPSELCVEAVYFMDGEAAVEGYRR